MSNIKLGVTLYCFTKEYCDKRLSFEDCVRLCAEMGVNGYEIVATQMIPSYPYVSDEFLGLVNRLKAEYGIAPVCYAANTDMGMRFDRDLNDEELFSSTLRDLKSANKLGCKVMRSQYLLSPQVLVKIAPYAEMYDVKVGIEIHNPETPSTPKMLEYYDAIVTSKSKYIGFVPDLGAFANKPNIDSDEGALERGANKAMLDYAVKLRYDEVPMAVAQKELENKGADPEVMKAFFNNYGFLTFYTHPDYEGLKKILPYCFEIHGKFHHMLPNGTERSIPYEEIIPILKDNNYNGYIISEYEGHARNNAVEMVGKHISMMKRLLAE